MPKHKVGTLSEFPAGTQRIVDVDGRSIGVFNVGDCFYALRDRCPHQGGPLCVGKMHAGLESDRPGRYEYVEGEHLAECPWHVWEFDLATGQSWFDPLRTRVSRIASVSSRLVDGRTLGLHTAEAYPVVVEGAEVLVEIPD